MPENINATRAKTPSDGIDLADIFQRQPRDPSALVVDGYGLRIQVDRGHLTIHDGIGTHRRTRRLPRIERTISRLIILGQSGSISLGALAWCRAVGISVTHIDPNSGEVVMTAGANGRDDPRLRRAQALATTRPIGLAITQELITEKIQRQAAVLRNLNESKAAETLEARAHAIRETPTLASIASVESKAANTYFALWTRNVTTTFATRDIDRVPEHWLRFDSRGSVIDYGRSPRKATTPVNAILNYCYALAEADCRIALLALGLDPGLGILHTDKKARDSLALDMIEPIRPLIDQTVLDLLTSRRFRAADFHQTPAGQCRLLAPLTHELADLSRGWLHDIATTGEYIAHSLAKDSPSPIPLRTPLTGANNLAAQAKRSRRRPRSQAPATAPAARTCRDCGTTLGPYAKALCETCWPVSRNATLANRNAKAAAKRTALAAAGKDPSNTPEARAKRREALIAERAARAAWEAANPDFIADREVYRTEIASGIATASVRRIAQATGLSSSAASKIRRGLLMPHPRHWDALSRIEQRPQMRS